MTIKNLYGIYEILDKLADERVSSPDETYFDLVELKSTLNIILTIIRNEKFDYQSSLPLQETLKKRLAFEQERMKKIDGLLSNFQDKLRTKIQQNKQLKDKISSLEEYIKDYRQNSKEKGIAYFEKNLKPNDKNTIFLLAQIFASEYIPFSQGLDPLLSATSDGQCYGFTDDWSNQLHYYGKTPVNLLVTPAIAKKQKRNLGFFEEFTKCIVSKTMTNKFAPALWDILEKIDANNLYLLSFAKHATGIRSYGDQGIEFFDPNSGIFRFKTKYDFVNFMSIYLLMHYYVHQNSLNLKLYELPGKNYRRDDDVNRQFPVKTEEKIDAIVKLEKNIKAQYATQNKQAYRFAGLILQNCLSNLINPDKNSTLHVLINHIEKEINRLNNKPKDPKITSKIHQITTDLQTYKTYVMHKNVLDNVQKAILLFVLMEKSLQIKTGSFEADSYQNIGNHVSDIQPDRELLQKFRLELRNHPADKPLTSDMFQPLTHTQKITKSNVMG